MVHCALFGFWRGTLFRIAFIGLSLHLFSYQPPPSPPPLSSCTMTSPENFCVSVFVLQLHSFLMTRAASNQLKLRSADKYKYIIIWVWWYLCTYIFSYIYIFMKNLLGCCLVFQTHQLVYVHDSDTVHDGTGTGTNHDDTAVLFSKNMDAKWW